MSSQPQPRYPSNTSSAYDYDDHRIVSNATHYAQIRKSSSAYFDSTNQYRASSVAHHDIPTLTHSQMWSQSTKDAVYYYGVDILLGKLIIMIFKTPNTHPASFSSLVISKLGSFESSLISLNKHSKYYLAVKNLPADQQNDNSRKILAISILRLYASLSSSQIDTLRSLNNNKDMVQLDLDESIAGELASRMKLIDTQFPKTIGDLILSLGYIQDPKTINSCIIDVIYDNINGITNQVDESLIDKNNELAFLLGDQLEHLFDPLTEYSPEPIEKVYKAPLLDDDSNDKNGDDILVKNICLELLKVQTNITVSLVTFLQKFIIPLRIKVMSGKFKLKDKETASYFTTAQLNQIFPPTIDEVTRINCIFLDVLNLAMPYGSFEILKACGMTVPYFYKAYMRHEAATKNFSQLFTAFINDCDEVGIDIFDNENSIVYDKVSIESLIHSSLNLTKIQLIINRLYESKDWEFSTNRAEEAKIYYNSTLDTISSFGNASLKPYSNRIFTPTGKLLTELASDWPIDLQFGWLTRRVVAVFDIRNIVPSNIKDMYVLIVFNDYLLLLEIVDDSYYVDMNNTNSNEATMFRPSIADCLMHSLINEVPIINQNIPKMKVNSWSKINEIIANHHEIDTKSYLNLMFLNHQGEPTIENKNKRFVFEVLQSNTDYVIDVLNKAKILDKSQPFHLFKSINEQKDFYVYYSAHERESYSEEEITTPIKVYLNKEFDMSLLKDKSIHAIVCLSLVDDKIRLQAISQSHLLTKNVSCYKEDLKFILNEVINDFVIEYQSLDNPYLFSWFINLNEQLLNQLMINLSITTKIKRDQLKQLMINADREKKLQEKQQQLQRHTKRGSSSRSLDLLTEGGPNRMPSTIRKGKLVNPDKEEIKQVKKVNKTSKKPGFFSRIFKKTKPTSAKVLKPDSKTTTKPISQLGIPSDSTNQKKKKESVSKKRLSQMFFSGDSKNSHINPIHKKTDLIASPEKPRVLKDYVDYEPNLKPIDYNRLQFTEASMEQVQLSNDNDGEHEDKVKQEFVDEDAEKTINTMPNASLIDVSSPTSPAAKVASLAPQTSLQDQSRSTTVQDMTSNTANLTNGSSSIYVNSHFEFPYKVSSSVISHNPNSQSDFFELYPENDDGLAISNSGTSGNIVEVVNVDDKDDDNCTIIQQAQSQNQELINSDVVVSPTLAQKQLPEIRRLNDAEKDKPKISKKPRTPPTSQVIDKLMNPFQEDGETGEKPKGYAGFTSIFAQVQSNLVQPVSTITRRNRAKAKELAKKKKEKAEANQIKGIWPVEENSDGPQPLNRGLLLYSPSVRKKLTNLAEQMDKLNLASTDENERKESEEGNWEVFNTGDPDRVQNFTDIERQTEKIKASQSNPADKSVDMFGSLDFADIDLDMDLDMDMTPDVEDEQDDDTDHTSIAENFYTPKEYPDAVFANIDQHQSNSILPNQITDYDDRVDATSLCSALKDMKNTTEGEILLKAMNGNRVYSQNSINSYYNDLLNDNSFDYLGDFLYGDMTVTQENAGPNLKVQMQKHMQKRMNDYEDHDKYFAERLRDSSLSYLASIIRSGKTEKNLHSFLKEPPKQQA